MAEKLIFDILTGKNTVSGDLDKAAQQAQYLNSVMGGLSPTAKNAGDEISRASKEASSFANSAVGIAVGTAAYQVFSSAISFVKSSITESIDAFAESEDAVNRLGQALRLTGSDTQSARDDITSFASALQASSKFNDEAIIGQFNFAKSLGTTNAQAKALVLAGANLSATLGGSLEENVDKLGKTLSGTAGRLAQYIPELRSLTQEQLKNGEAADLINKKYSGAAANDLKTYSGQVASLKNSFNDLQEVLGKTIVQSGLFQSIMNRLKIAVDEAKIAQDAYSVQVLGMAGANAIGTKTASQLTEDTKKLAAQITIINKEIEDREKAFVVDPIEAAQEEAAIARLRLQLDGLSKAKAQIESQKLGPVLPEAKDVAPAKVKTNEELDAEKKKNAEILAAKREFQLQKDTFEEANLNLEIQNDAARDAAKLTTMAEFNAKIVESDNLQQNEELIRLAEFNIKKAEIDAQLKEDSLSSSLSQEEKKLEIQKIALDKQLALEKIKNDTSIQQSKNTNKTLTDNEKNTKQALIEVEKSFQNSKYTLIGQGFQLGAALAKDGSKEQFLINKAGAVAEVLIGDAKARALIPAQTAMIPFPANLAAAAGLNSYVTAQTSLGLGIIAATAIKGFAEGGIVGATTGADNRIASIRDGEMVLNANQQKKLFDMINNGGSGGGDIIVQIDGREVARAVRNQIQGGFVLA